MIILYKMPVKKSELDFYESVKDFCFVIFDVGCREDVTYAENSEGKIIHMFEPNPVFFYNCVQNMSKLPKKNEVHLNNFGLGSKTTFLEYWVESQSFFKRLLSDFNYSTEERLTLPIQRFSDYISEHNVDRLDFLKIDTEGYELEVLLDNIQFVKENLSFVQFEWTNGWKDKGEKISLYDVCGIFDNFKFGFLYDEDHPLSEHYKSTITKIISPDVIKEIQKLYTDEGFGLDIIMWKNNYDIN